MPKAEMGGGQGSRSPVANAMRRHLPNPQWKAAEPIVKAWPRRQHQPDGGNCCFV
jgi:hypothetical protein